MADAPSGAGVGAVRADGFGIRTRSCGARNRIASRHSAHCRRATSRTGWTANAFWCGVRPRSSSPDFVGGTLSLARPIALVYVVLLARGAAQAFNNPARQALLPQLVPPEVFGNAVTWASSAFQVAAVVGPGIGGIVIAIQKGATGAYVISSILTVIYLWTLLEIRGLHPATLGDTGDKALPAAPERENDAGVARRWDESTFAIRRSFLPQ